MLPESRLQLVQSHRLTHWVLETTGSSSALTQASEPIGQKLKLTQLSEQ